MHATRRTWPFIRSTCADWWPRPEWQSSCLTGNRRRRRSNRRRTLRLLTDAGRCIRVSCSPATRRLNSQTRNVPAVVVGPAALVVGDMVVVGPEVVLEEAVRVAPEVVEV